MATKTSLTVYQQRLLRSRLGPQGLRLGQRQVTLGEAYSAIKDLSDEQVVEIVQSEHVVSHKHVKDLVKSIRSLVREHGPDTRLTFLL